MDLDISFVRQHFPAFQGDSRVDGYFFDSAAGSFPCGETIESLSNFYRYTKVQPGNGFEPSQTAWEKMQYSRARWAEALSVKVNELGFGPSTTQNLYVLSQAFSEILRPGDEVILTNQDHESNIGAMRRAIERAGATLVEWQVNSESGLLDQNDFSSLLSDKTKLVCVPHSSNVTGQKNNIKQIVALAHKKSAIVLIDAVASAPHEIEDITALGVDIYLFSLYKVYSVHLGLMVMRESVMAMLPKQGYYFKNVLDVHDRFVPAGYDHAQIAAAGAVLDYIETLSAHHGGPANNLREACQFVAQLWRRHEASLMAPLVELISGCTNIRLIGSDIVNEDRCPIVSFVPINETAEDWAHILCDQKMLVSYGSYNAPRLLEAMGIEAGVLRISLAHYNNIEEVGALCQKISALNSQF